ncbi:MAG TPA: glycoside hydrolase family 3 N-terminal domain-containing protein [Actinophytocola sp.]|uniref:glycoside hydrolase family 3 N-terminal domain-containing protein n=1 Tax=Actinophytocola sp. TaxID=1872138 RepID=UPI002DB7F6C3|nr:glycoside hydrolase family 3 N-terminal domain-containing protein [Actinophytocola sp.]HEU5470201.1 glycoside hydrolase family 3 N-terminal domain-containing protein [Actinophytocola sp.]
MIATLSVRQKLGQLLMVGVNPASADAAAAVVRTGAVGGIFLGGTATDLLTENGLGPVRAAANLPLAVAVDEEGGRVQRIDAVDGKIPSPRTMSRTMNPDQVRDLARTRGRALRARGVTMDFAPVVDITDQPDGAVIGDRSFGSDPAVVATYALAFAQGLREAGILPVVKHFPGHGRTSGDSHRGPVTTPPLAQLRTLDLLPYRAIQPTRPTAVMIGHLDVPDLTGGRPASLAPATYRLLRTEYAFTGPAITDDLGGMRAVTTRHPLPEAVLLALTAGADIAFWSSGDRLPEVITTLEQAFTSGRLPLARVDEALHRTLRAKSICSGS